jgi:hypothetical protein
MKKMLLSRLVFAAAIGVALPMPAVYVGYTAQEDRHKKELQECADELVEPNKCGKLWQYASSLEDENSRLNASLRVCLDK